MFRLIGYVAAEAPWLLLLVLGFSIVSAVFTVGVLVLFFKALGAEPEAVTWVQYVAYVVLTVTTRSLARTLLARLTRQMVRQMRVRLSGIVMGTPLADIERIGSSKLINALTEDIGRIATALPDLVTVFANLAFIALCLAYLGMASPGRLMVIVVAILVGVAGFSILRRRYIRKQVVTRRLWGRLSQTFQTAIGGIKEIKLDLGRRRRVMATIEREAAELQDAASSQANYMLGMLMLTNVLLYVALGLSIFDIRGGILDEHLMAAYGISILYMSGPFRILADVLPNMAAANVAMQQLDALNLQLEQGRRSWEDASVAALAQPVRSLAAKRIEHRYPNSGTGDSFMLGPVDLELQAGQTLFIVGGNGTGKTTLAKILTGLYLHTGGVLRVNGRDLDVAQVGAYRQRVAATFGDFELFDELVSGDEPLNEARAQHILGRLGMADRVRIEQGRIVMPGGLSTGERKRMALLGALLADRDVYLFDELAADQDPVFREFFYRELLPELSGRDKLVIVISHDDRYFSLADVLLVLERGEPPRLGRPPSRAGVGALAQPESVPVPAAVPRSLHRRAVERAPQPQEGPP